MALFKWGKNEEAGTTGWNKSWEIQFLVPILRRLRSPWTHCTLKGRRLICWEKLRDQKHPCQWFRRQKLGLIYSTFWRLDVTMHFISGGLCRTSHCEVPRWAPLKWAILGKVLFPALFCHFNTPHTHIHKNDQVPLPLPGLLSLLFFCCFLVWFPVLYMLVVLS